MSVITRVWNPRHLPGIVGWWQVDETEEGLTIVEASVSTDMTSDWMPYGIINPISSAYGSLGRLEEVLAGDESAVTHAASSPMINAQSGPVTLSVTCKFNGDNNGGLYLSIAGAGWVSMSRGHNSSNQPIYFDSDGSVLSYSGTSIDGGECTYTLTATTSSPTGTVTIGMLGPNGEMKYQGDGTSSVDILAVKLTQRLITSVANRIPHGPPLVPFNMATAPKLYDAALNTWTGSEGFYCNELEGLRDSTTIAPMFSGTNVPFVVYHVCRGQTGVDGGRIYEWYGGVGSQGIYQHGVTPTVLRAHRTDASGAVTPITAADAYPANTRSATCDYFDGTTRTLSTINGTLSVGQERGEQALARFGWACSPRESSVHHPMAGNFSCLILSTQSRIRGDEYDLVMRRWIANVYGVTV